MINQPINKNSDFVTKDQYHWAIIVTIVLTSVFLIMVMFAAGQMLDGSYIRTSALGSVEISEEKYYAITLDNGDKYYGKIAEADSNFVTLKDVYYPHPDSSHKLIARNSEIHSPSNMNINREKLISIEALRNDSAVFKAILKFKK